MTVEFEREGADYLPGSVRALAFGIDSPTAVGVVRRDLAGASSRHQRRTPVIATHAYRPFGLTAMLARCIVCGRDQAAHVPPAKPIAVAA